VRQILEDVGHILEYCLIAVVMVLIGLGVGYFLRKNIAEGKLNQAEQEAARIIAAAQKSAAEEATLAAERARDQLREQVAQLAVTGAERILKREIDAKQHADLLSNLKNELR